MININCSPIVITIINIIILITIGKKTMELLSRLFESIHFCPFRFTPWYSPINKPSESLLTLFPLKGFFCSNEVSTLPATLLSIPSLHLLIKTTVYPPSHPSNSSLWNLSSCTEQSGTLSLFSHHNMHISHTASFHSYLFTVFPRRLWRC